MINRGRVVTVINNDVLLSRIRFIWVIAHALKVLRSTVTADD